MSPIGTESESDISTHSRAVPPADVAAEERRRSNVVPDRARWEATSPPAPAVTRMMPAATARWILLTLSIATIGTIWLARTGGGFVSSERWWFFAVAFPLLGMLVMPSLKSGLRAKTPNFKAALIIFVGIPLVVVLLAAIVVYPPRYQVAALRAVFLLIVCLLPAAMWYLFIGTRKASLLNEFLDNLRCLGLLRKPDPAAGSQSEVAYRRRVYNYLERFQAAYGPLPTETKKQVVACEFSSELTVPAGWSVLSTNAIPVLFLTALLALGWIVSLPPTPESAAFQLAGEVPLGERWLAALAPAETPISFAFLGAYFFTVQMLFRRYIRKDLLGAAYVHASMRVILAVIGAWVAVAALRDIDAHVTSAQQLVIGFTVGFFPPVLWELVKGSVRWLGAVVLRNENEIPLRDLDGVTVWHQVRLEEEDIENVPNMASADIVELLLNTKLPPDRIIDWVDQAILYTCMGKDREERKKLRRHGIRSASGLIAAAKTGAGSAFLEDGETRIPAIIAAVKSSPNFELVERWKANYQPDVPLATLELPEAVNMAEPTPV